MSYKIAIASGKGGTGKTTVAVSIYQLLAQNFNGRIQLVDCDVEEPNDSIFFPEAIVTNEVTIKQDIPKIEIEPCTFCRKCADYCEFNAIVVLPSAQFAEVNASLCHSCGACLVACDSNAITQTQQAIGKVTRYSTTTGEGIVEGKLKVGSAMQTMLIKQLKKSVDDQQDIVIYDAPPGTSCSVVETTVDADFVLLVTEPTPFGLHDLKLTVELMKALDKDFGVIVNKAGLGDHKVYQFLKDNHIELVGEIPFVSSFASSYARGNLTMGMPHDVESSLNCITDKILERITNNEGDNHT